MSDAPPGPTDKQIALFRAVEDIHDLTRAITVLLVDADGAPVAVSGDIADVPAPMLDVLSGKQLAEAGSVVELLSRIGNVEGPPLNLSIFDVGSLHVLAILFDAESDLFEVRSVGDEAKEMIGEILRAPLD